MCRALLRELGLAVGSDVRLELNSLGQAAERSAHRAALIAYLNTLSDNPAPLPKAAEAAGTPKPQ